MALRVLDGNQTATTLSSVVTGGEHIVAHSVVSLGANAIANIASAVSGSVVSISNFPSTQTIAGTVTANVENLISQGYDIVGNPYRKGVQLIGVNWDNDNDKPVNTDDTGQLRIIAGAGSPNFPISGTVTVNSLTDALLNSAPAFGIAGDNYGEIPAYGVQLGFGNTNGDFETATQTNPFPIRGTVTIGSLPAISGTVTANNPSGALTTRFGSVTTASVAQITSAVTNTSRKYLLAQNISAGTVTIGIGFSPTTTQGIQLTAGGGLTFDAFCPTGAVYWLGAVTGAAFTILEG